jgi:DNA-binding transcriptional ArsR family regulator
VTAAASSGDAQPVFEALADRTRRALYEDVVAGGEATATQLSEVRPVTRQAVAKHLGVLARAGLVTSERRGRETVYRATPAPLDEVARWIAATGAAWEDRLRDLVSVADDLAAGAPDQPDAGSPAAGVRKPRGTAPADG